LVSVPGVERGTASQTMAAETISPAMTSWIWSELVSPSQTMNSTAPH
jgi:hypothetical protein